MVEILVVIAIISIVVGAAIMNFGQARNQALLEEGQSSIINVLELARNRAASGVGSTSTKHGVRINSDRIIIFEGDNYPGIGPTTTIMLPSGLSTDKSDFDIIFDRISGKSSTGTTIVINNHNGTTSVEVTESGLIYEK